MKAEYVEAKNETTNGSSNNMFAKLHHPHPHHPHHQQSPPQKFPPQRFLLHRSPFHPDCPPTPEDDESPSAAVSAAPTVSSSAAAAAAAAAAISPSASGKKPGRGQDSGGDGATIEVVRRPRGRPPGSKNKPKPPVIITRDPEPAMSPYIMEVAGGVDVVEAVARFSRRRGVGLCILTASGTVANVTLRQPSATPGATVTFHGRFDILSLSAAILPPEPQLPPSAAAAFGGAFTISLAGAQGQIVGGMVSGALIAAGTVYVVAASFDSPSYHRLPAEADGGGGSSVSGNEGQSPPAGVEMSMYSGHLPADVIWGPPTGRQQHQSPY